MVKFTGSNKKGETDLIGLGLSAGNIKRLKKGDPICFDVSELNIQKLAADGKVLIFFGKTEEAMREYLSEFIGPDTNITDKSRVH